MILPSKHLKLSNSLLNTGAILLKFLSREQTVTLLWDKTKHLPEIKTYERFILALDLLYLLNLIDFYDGLIMKVKR